MHDIKLTGNFGLYVNTVLCSPSGTRGDSYHIEVSGWHHGQIVLNSDGVWRAYLNNNSELTKDDIDIFIEAIEKHRQQDNP